MGRILRLRCVPGCPYAEFQCISLEGVVLPSFSTASSIRREMAPPASSPVAVFERSRLPYLTCEVAHTRAVALFARSGPNAFSGAR
jgi:hypothetical protein